MSQETGEGWVPQTRGGNIYDEYEEEENPQCSTSKMSKEVLEARNFEEAVYSLNLRNWMKLGVGSSIAAGPTTALATYQLFPGYTETAEKILEDPVGTTTEIGDDFMDEIIELSDDYLVQIQNQAYERVHDLASNPEYVANMAEISQEISNLL